ncbi:MAG: tRNA (N6-isopentenyl adenosine(37)-C2)-methylthiotransferase MiaB [Candidatus Omnitrophica bacterium]|nr:tRNA (N6-isopentenyl adenosine(37)-C2)-methylthiotransferase MiaB [Candidatus Omnitrophota bacterium]
MNVRDAEEVTGLLLEKGYVLTDAEEAADVILFNTCSVREHAEDKVWSSLGTLRDLKRERPELIIGVMGCMAKAQRGKIFRRAPHVDFISGPSQLYEVPELIDAIYEERRPMMAIQEKVRKEFQTISYHSGKVTALVTIMEGCNKVCSYCIIPYTRGPEVSRPPEEIIEEIKRLVGQGYREVMLLGQNVNSYGKKLDPPVSFGELLALVNAVPGIERIRFITSHPWDAVEGLFTAMRDLEHVCEHLHLPVQSGSDPILKKMRRGYTAGEYLRKLALLRSFVPGVAVTTDFIVGFPGETEADFEATLQLAEEARFDSAFIFSYSPRPFAAASRWVDDVPREVKERRLQELLHLQERISREEDEKQVGRTVEVLVEQGGMGRSRTNRKVYFQGEASPGELIQVQAESVRGHSLVGVKRAKGLIAAGLGLALFLGGTAFASQEELLSVQAAYLKGEHETVLSKTKALLAGMDPAQKDELLYLQGVSALKLRDPELAKASFERLLSEAPESPRASRARELLKSDSFVYSVQVGAFGSFLNARKLTRELEARGHEASVSETLLDGQRFFRVRVGRYANRQSAEEEAERLRQEGFSGKVVP